MDTYIFYPLTLVSYAQIVGYNYIKFDSSFKSGFGFAITLSIIIWFATRQSFYKYPVDSRPKIKFFREFKMILVALSALFVGYKLNVISNEFLHLLASLVVFAINFFIVSYVSHLKE